MKLANIVPISKPNKDTDKGTPYRPSNCKHTGEEPSSLHSSKYTKHTHATRVHNTTLYSDGTIHTTYHRSKGVQPNGSPFTNNYCSTRYEQSFRRNKLHTLIRKLLQTNIPGTIIKFIANYIKGRKAYTTYINYTSRQRQLKTGVPQGSVLSPTQYNIYIPDFPPSSAPFQVKAYADAINTHPHTQERVQPNIYTTIPTYSFCLDKTKQSHTKSRQNNLHPVHGRPCRIYGQSVPKIHNKALPMATHPKVLGFT